MLLSQIYAMCARVTTDLLHPYMHGLAYWHLLPSYFLQSSYIALTNSKRFGARLSKFVRTDTTQYSFTVSRSSALVCKSTNQNSMARKLLVFVALQPVTAGIHTQTALPYPEA